MQSFTDLAEETASFLRRLLELYAQRLNHEESRASLAQEYLAYAETVKCIAGMTVGRVRAYETRSPFDMYRLEDRGQEMTLLRQLARNQTLLYAFPEVRQAVDRYQLARFELEEVRMKRAFDRIRVRQSDGPRRYKNWRLDIGVSSAATELSRSEENMIELNEDIQLCQQLLDDLASLPIIA